MMNSRSRASAEALRGVRAALAARTVELQYERDPTLRERYGPGGERIWRAQAESRVAHLVEAVAADRPALFAQDADWCRLALGTRDVSTEDIAAHYRALRDAASEDLPPELARACVACIEDALAALGREPPAEQRLTDACGRGATLARLYLLHLLQRERGEARRIVDEAMRGGASLADVHEQIVIPAMREIGRMWQLQEASIADEHYCTAATQAILAEARLAAPRAAWNGRRALCCAVDGDLHDLGVRMTSDLLEVDGWQTEFLGASTPSADIVMTLAGDFGPASSSARSRTWWTRCAPCPEDGRSRSSWAGRPSASSPTCGGSWGRTPAPHPPRTRWRRRTRS
jgi:methanogenic corrinoid protein MtbC1